MATISIDVAKDRSSAAVVRTDASSVRRIVVRVGEEYVIEPVGPGRSRNRGRMCVVLGIEDREGEDAPAIYAKIRFLDTNRMGRAEFAELAPNRRWSRT